VKIDWNKKYTTYAVYAAAICAALIFLIFCGVYFSNIWDGFLHVLGVLSPLIYGCIIAYIFTPIVNFFERKLLIGIKHGVVRRGVSVFNTYILFFAVITLLVYAVVPQIVRSFNDLQTTLALFTDSIQDWLNTISAQSEFMASVVEKINEVVDISALTSSLGNIIGLIYDLTAKFSPYIVGFIGSFMVQLRNIILGLVFAGYLLCSKELVFAQINKILHAFVKEEKLNKLSDEIKFVDKTFGKYIIGTFADAIIIGVMTAITLSIFRMPYVPLISVLVACTNIIPIFGPFIGAVPSFIFIFISDPIKALWFIVIILVLQQVDGNIIAPRILGSSTGIPPIIVITAITIMGGIFGMAGMVIAVPVFAVLAKVIYEKTEKKIAKQAEAADAKALEESELDVTEKEKCSENDESDEEDAETSSELPELDSESEGASQ